MFESTADLPDNAVELCAPGKVTGEDYQRAGARGKCPYPLAAVMASRPFLTSARKPTTAGNGPGHRPQY